MRYALLSGASAAAFAGASALAMGLASPAMAGDIVLTGHDNDFHCAFGDTNACNVLGAEVSFVKAGSGLEGVLAIDAGTELSTSLGLAGVAFDVVTPGAVTAGMFDHSKYSAFVVASVTSCGGCDNPAGTGAGLASAFEPQIVSFFNSGGGILGLAGAEDPTAYADVPRWPAERPRRSSALPASWRPPRAWLVFPASPR